jgi:hypothetical protein
MNWKQIGITAIIAAVVAYYVHDYLDNMRNAHGDSE